MRLKRSRSALPDQERITPEGDTAVVRYTDPSIRAEHLRVSPSPVAMSDAEVIVLFNGMPQAQTEIATGVDPTLTEMV